jgi:hypothetical protein
MARKNRIAVDIVAGIDEETIELAERLGLGDGESVWAWSEHHYPKVMGPVHRRQLVCSAGNEAELIAGRAPNALRQFELEP